MKTQQQAQKIFDVLSTQLQESNMFNLHYANRNLHTWPEDSTKNTPIEHFLKEAKEELTEKDVSEEFLNRVYAEAFHSGPIPKTRNHLEMTCYLQVKSGPTSPALRFWVDLDKVAALLNTHLRINPPYRFKMNFGACSASDHCNAIKFATRYETRLISEKDPASIYFNSLLGWMVIGCVSVYATLVAGLAVASIITLSTAGIGTAVGLVVGVASYYFFKARPGVNTTVAPIEESSPENIEDIFRNHFAATIGMTILPQDCVEIINDEQALKM